MNATEKPGDGHRRRIFLLRHGDVSYFDEHGMPVRPDVVPLNAEGIVQAQSASQELANIPFDRAISSDLPRSQETARIITGQRNLTLETIKDLREIQPGRLRDIPTENIQKAFLEAFGSEINRETVFLAGEKFGVFCDRVLSALEKLLADVSWRNLLLVAHGGVNRVILTHALGSGLKGFAALEQDPCCLNIVDIDSGGRYLARLINYTSYNRNKVGMELTTMEKLYQEFVGKNARACS